MKHHSTLRRGHAWLIFFVLSTAPAWGNDYRECGWETCACKKNLFDLRARWMAARTEAPPGNGRQYSRDRLVDVTHQRIEITPDFKKRSLEGIATTSFSPIAKALGELELDAVDLRVGKLESSHPVDSWDNDDERILVVFSEPIPAGTPAWVRVHYSAEPQHGLYFRTAEMGYPEGDDHLWTQGEPEKHRHWFPGYDFPNERFTTEVICHVPEAMTVLSNGTLISDTKKDGIRTVHWHQKKEHVNYLVSVVAGHFKKLEDTHGELPLAFLTTPSHFAVAENSFRDTARILAFLEKEIGVAFPWAKYYNVCVADFIAGGMENTSISTLTNGTLFSADSETLRSSHRLDAHEATHQWFGDLLTCRDWSQLWLNEGFATYYTHLYEGHKNGRDDMLYGLYRDLVNVTGRNDTKPIVWREFRDPWEQFDFRAYPKGSWVLHMLRCQLGADLYRKCIQTYVERHRNTIVETSDLQKVFEELSGRSLDEFFDQWVYHGGTPHLEVKYQWNPKKKQARFTVRQTQKISDQVLLFDFPLPIRVIGESGKVVERVLPVRNSSEDFDLDLPEKPVVVRVDPELTVLARVTFQPPKDLFDAQLRNGKDMLGRLIAVKALAKRKDSASLKHLEERLNGDTFYGVRIEAAKSLSIHRTPEAFAILVKSTEQPDARVRKEVVTALAKFYSGDALAALKKISESEKNPEIVAEALRHIGIYPFSEVNELLVRALDRESFRHRIAVAAIRAMREQGATDYAAPLKKHLVANASRFTTRDLGTALDSLAYLSRDLDDPARNEVRTFIASMVDHPKTPLRPGVIRALGTLEDERSLPLLQPLTLGDEGDPVVKAATDTIKKINAGGKQADEVKDLREEVLQLKRELEKLRKERSE